MYTIILDELNILKSKDIQKYFLRYFNVNEMKRISFIVRYKSSNEWHCKLSRSGRTIWGNTLKDLVINLLSNDSYLNELLGGI